MIFLGIETSCDETAAAVVDDDGTVRADVVLSQIEEHRPYGGIVPEIAARAHLETLDGVIRRAMGEAEMDFAALDGIAATAGPGLLGGLIVGVMTAKGIAAAHDLPFVAVNHLEGHALTARLTDRVAFPYLLLLVPPIPAAMYALHHQTMRLATMNCCSCRATNACCALDHALNSGMLELSESPDHTRP